MRRWWVVVALAVLCAPGCGASSNDDDTGGDGDADADADAGTCESDCPVLAETRCNDDHNVVERCTLIEDHCLMWVETDDCAALGGWCEVGPEGPACTCASCPTPTRCNGDVVEICTDDASGCGRWVASEDCSSSGRSCGLLGRTAVCAGCSGVDICDADCGIVGALCQNGRNCEFNVEGVRLALTCLDEETYGYPGGYCASVSCNGLGLVTLVART